MVSYKGEDGRRHRMWLFVMGLGFSRAIYLEFVRRADVPTFIRCHLKAFDYFGGVPEALRVRQCQGCGSRSR